ncbi:LytR/AlgR family response regulator transcription factor [Clostridium formicaceticum]|nr:LytTR family DNA-binding domain-containing protein [Clostridium formicaceticum]AOY75346.1 hypothetical protein BJL90_05170 [Clostridium formicaceticum]
MITILIGDDYQYTRKMLEKIASENPFVSRIFAVEDGLEAVKIVQQETIDIALLDIDMPNLNGIEAAKIISKMSPKTKFVFITAHMDYAIDSFAVHPYNYLLKPIDISVFKDNINELVMSITSEPKQSSISMITVKDKNNTCMLSLKEIIYFQKVDKATVVHTNKEEYLINKTLTELENKLNSNFLRVHQSFIINIDKTAKIQDMGDRSYRIEFNGTKKTAYMSRYRFEKLKGTFTF